MSESVVTGARPGDARPDAPSDADLITAVRAGDLEAYGELFARHVDSARRLARSLSHDGEADDLVSEAFAKVLVVLQRGEGPDTALRPYLLTALRRLHVDRVRSVSRARPTDDLEAYDEGEAFHDTAVAGFESGAAARAFASLPERWRLVLWHLEVEGQKPADVAPLLGISANSVSALAYRAREGLRQAFVSMHAQEATDTRCAETRARLGAFIRNDISKRDGAAVEEHLRDCRECAGIYLELVEVNSDLRVLIAPIVLGGAATAYLGGGAVIGSAGTVGSAGLGGLLSQVGGLVTRSWGTSVAAAAAVGVVVAGAIAGVQAVGDDEVSATTDRASAVAPGPAAEAPADQVDGSQEVRPEAADDGEEPEPTGPATSSPDEARDDPTPDPTSDPTEDPTPNQTQDPTRDPTEEPTPDEPVVTDPPEPVTTSPSVRASAQAQGGLVWDVSLAVADLTPGTTGTLTITLDQPAAGIHLDPRCDLLSLGSLSCRLTGPATVRLLVTPLPGVPTTLTARLAPGDQRSSVRLG